MLNFKKLMSTFVKNSFNIIFFKFFFIKIQISGKSMEPNFQEGETYILRKTQNINLFKRFEPIILFCNIHNKLHLKRLLAYPGENLTVRNGKIYINNNYIDSLRLGTLSFNILISKNSFFTFSDNFKTNSKNCDSLSTGPIKKGQIVGKIFS